MTSYEIEARTLESQETAVEYATLQSEEIDPWLAQAFSEVTAYLDRKGAGHAGMPFARYHRVDGDRFEVEAGLPSTTPTAGEGDIEPSDLPAGLAAVTVHVGTFGPIVQAWEALQAWVLSHGGQPVGDGWEVYFRDPIADADLSTWRTEVIQPYRTL